MTKIEELKMKHLQKALESDPQGAICYRCGVNNDFYDDIGWFYTLIDRTLKGKPSCNHWWGASIKATSMAEWRAICLKCWRELDCRSTGDR